MNNAGFSVGALLKKSWRVFKERWVFFILVFLVTVLITYAPDGINQAMGDSRFSWIWSLLHFVLYFVMMVGLYNVMIVQSAGMKANFWHLFSKAGRFFYLFCGSFLYSLIVVGGFILLIFPAAIWGAKFAFFPFFIVDQNAGPIEALKMSSRATNGVKWDVLALLIILVLVNLLGLAALLLGLFVTQPVTLLAQAFAYRLLIEKTRAEVIPISATEP